MTASKSAFDKPRNGSGSQIEGIAKQCACEKSSEVWNLKLRYLTYELSLSPAGFRLSHTKVVYPELKDSHIQHSVLGLVGGIRRSAPKVLDVRGLSMESISELWGLT